MVTAAAEVSQAFLTRAFDVTQGRRAQTQRLAERAVQLAPDNPEALAALGTYLLSDKTQLGRAEELLRKAIMINPNEARFHRTLYAVLAQTASTAEADAFGERMLSLFPNDPLVTYDIALRNLGSNNLAATETWVDKTLAIAPLGNAITLKARLALEMHGDVPGMVAWLERMPARQRTNNARMVTNYMAQAVITGQTEPAQRLLDSITDTWLSDLRVFLPKTLIQGEIAQIDGRGDVARLQYEAALKEVQSQLSADPSDLRPVSAELWALLGLGRQDEARVRELRTLRVREPAGEAVERQLHDCALICVTGVLLAQEDAPGNEFSISESVGLPLGRDELAHLIQEFA